MRMRLAQLILAALIVAPAPLAAQQAPALGYIYPPGGAAGSTIDVLLGGYDWTPDMQVFVLDSRIKLEITAPPGPVIVPEPPYWFGKKARRGPFLLPRETEARLTIPADFPPGIVEWQAANANGATKRGRFVVGNGTAVTEEQDRKSPQSLSTLPAAVSGRIQNIEEVDRYRFTATKSGPCTCRMLAQSIGSPLNAVVEIRDSEGQLIADAADTSGRDVVLTFAAVKGTEYTISLFDVDFRGNRAFVYRLEIIPGPGLLAAIPATGKPGETKQVEFVGYGVASGGVQLESLKSAVTFPANEVGSRFQFALTTPHGVTSPIELLLSDLPETVNAEQAAATPHKLTLPAAVTGVIENRYGSDRYSVSGKKDDVWSIAVETTRIGSPLDMNVAIFDADGKQLKTIDDTPGSVEAGFEFKVPADGEYQIVASDSSSQSGNRAATYRLVIENAIPAFEITTPELLVLPAEGKAQLSITAKRFGGFKEPIAISLTGLPAGVTAAADATIPAGKTAAKIELTSAAGSGTSAGLVQVNGTSTINEKPVTRDGGQTLVTITLKPPFVVDAEGKDDVTKWPRGSTFPGPVLIEREEGFTGEIVLQMAAKQGRHRQGIRGPELIVAPGVKRILYPVFLPEWLETTRTSRMVVNGVAKVADAKGNIRYSVSRLKTRIGFLPTGALLKIATTQQDVEMTPGQPLDVVIAISRARELSESAKLELLSEGEFAGMFQADPVVVESGTSTATIRVTPIEGQQPRGEGRLKFRATVLQNGELPAVSESSLLLIFPEN